MYYAMITSHAALDETSRRQMMEIGPVWGDDIPMHRDMVLRAYGPVLERAPKGGITVTRDFAYGSHARQVLDCFVPMSATSAPVVVFVHGGAFVRGDKRLSSEVYDNVLYWFAGQGFIAKRPAANHPWRFDQAPTADYCEPYWHRWRAM